MPDTGTVVNGGRADATASAELRAAVTSLSRRLRAENPFPSLAQAAVLGHLFDGGPRTTSWLAAAERVRPQSMAQVVRDLEQGGLVVRKPDDVDRRQVFVMLTTSGRRALVNDRHRRDAWFTQAISETLSPEERLLLLRAIPLLRRLSQH